MFVNVNYYLWIFTNLSILFCSFIYFFNLLRKEMKRWISGGGRKKNDKMVFPIQSALLFLFPAWLKVSVTWAPGDDVRIYQLGMWQRVEFKAAAISLPFPRLMTCDRSAEVGGAANNPNCLVRDITWAHPACDRWWVLLCKWLTLEKLYILSHGGFFFSPGND